MGHTKPSDWVDAPGQERSWTKIILLGSAGCLVMFVAAAALSTWGTCAGVSSCCDNVQQSHKAMVKPVQDLLDAVGDQDPQRAYLSLSDSYRESHSQADFDKFITQHDPLFKGGTARVVASRTLTRNRNKKRYMTVLILDSAGRSRGNATFLVRHTGKTNEHGDPIPIIDDIIVGEPEEVRQQNEVAAAVQEHLRLLGKGDYQGAWSLMDPSFTDQTDRETFKAYITSQGDLFGPEGKAKIQSMDSNGTNAEAIVQVIDLERFKARGTVVYRLMRGRDQVWRIYEMRTQIKDVETQPDPPKK